MFIKRRFAGVAVEKKSVLFTVAAVVLLMGCGGGGKAWASDYKLKVSVNPANGGSITISPNRESYNEWMDVEVTATPAEGYFFDGWSGESTEKSKGITIKMSGNKNKKLTANFKMPSISTFKDSRDGKTYKKVSIGTQTWMADNLNYATSGSACYGNSNEYCTKYGRLYNWSTAIQACPVGWHLPTHAEWETLIDFVGGKDAAGKMLKSQTGWNGNNGTNEYGFSALPGGCVDCNIAFNDARFNVAGEYGYWWSGSINYEDYGVFVWLSFNNSATMIAANKKCQISVRCVMLAGAADNVMAQKTRGTPPSITTFKDSRDGKSYKKLTIGKQTWMAENLNYNVFGSKCYDEDSKVGMEWDDDGNPTKTKTLSAAEVQSNCSKYGRLYNWSMAKQACPAGWHLPSDAEWTTLEDAVGGSETAGEKLKSTSGWDDNGNGTDEYEFAALPGGYGRSGGDFGNAGDNGRWWSATEYDANYAWYRSMNYSYEGVYRRRNNKSNLFSVRCVQD